MNVLLTGCSKGVGVELCHNLLSNGYTVYGISRTSSDRLNFLKKSYPDTFHHLEFDIKNIENIRNDIFSSWIGSKVQLDGFVNNAAVAYDDLITNLQLEPLENMFKVNVFAPFILTKYTIRNMLLNRVRGSIVHLSSISVHTGYKGLAMYAATKGALEAFSKNTSREWGARGIRSNCLVAGFMETEMSATLTNEHKLKIYNRTSLRSATSIQSVAESILFLLSDKSNSITGQNFHVDSGTI